MSEDRIRRTGIRGPCHLHSPALPLCFFCSLASRPLLSCNCASHLALVCHVSQLRPDLNWTFHFRYSSPSGCLGICAQISRSEQSFGFISFSGHIWFSQLWSGWGIEVPRGLICPGLWLKQLLQEGGSNWNVQYRVFCPFFIRCVQFLEEFEREVVSLSNSFQEYRVYLLLISFRKI